MCRLGDVIANGFQLPAGLFSLRGRWAVLWSIGISGRHGGRDSSGATDIDFYDYGIA